MTKLKYLFSFCLMAFIFVNAAFSKPSTEADSSFEKLTREGYVHIYQYELEKAAASVKLVQKKFPTRPFTYIFTANYYWCLLTSGEDNAANREKFQSAISSAAALLKKQKTDDLSDENLFVMISIYALKSRLELLEYNYLRAVFAFKDCVHYMKRSFGKEAEFEPFYLTSGLYNYLCDYGIKNYPILYPYLLFYPKGNMEKGIVQLVVASKSTDELTSTEGIYFLQKVYLELEPNQEKAVSYARQLTSRYPANLLYQYLLFQALIAGDDFGAVKKQLEVMNIKAILNHDLTPAQKSFFQVKAQEDLKAYYSKKD